MFDYIKLLSVDCTMSNIGHGSIFSLCNLRATMGRLTKQCELVIFIFTKLFCHLYSIFPSDLLRIVHSQANRVIPKTQPLPFSSKNYAPMSQNITTTDRSEEDGFRGT